MECNYTLLIFLSASVVAYAETEGEVRIHSQLRRAALAQFTYSDPTSKSSAAPVAIDSPPSEGPDVNVVVMKKMSITERLDDRELATDILKTRPTTAQSVTKLGTGVREKDFGKMRAIAVTVLYIPIRVGVSW